MRELDAAGHAVTATWIVDAERERIEEEFGDSVALVRADLFDPEATGAAVGAVDDLEAVVNLVGGFSAGPRVHETDVADFERMLRLNLLPGFNLAHAAMPLLVERGGGAYVGVSARAGLRPFAGAAGYVTGKAGVLAFVQALDAEYKGDGVLQRRPAQRDRHAAPTARRSPTPTGPSGCVPRRSRRWSASSSPRTRRPPQAPGFPSTGGLE